jgi:general secretion pathway protein J
MMRRAGFTLVEVLVALAVFALLSAGAVGVMQAAIGARDSAAERTSTLAGLQRLRGALAADLAQAAARATRDFAGAPAAFAFVLADPGDGSRPFLILTRRGWENPDGAPRASLQYVEYRLIEGRLERAVRAGLDGAPLEPPQVLARGVRAAAVSALGGGGWLPAWASANLEPLPRAVRIDLELEGLGAVPQWFLVSGDLP